MNIEPEAIEAGRRAEETGIGAEAGSQLVSLMSIAVSLKRIADNICYQQAGENLFDYIRQIAQAAEEGTRR